jgi:hypothetical protein
MTSSEGGSSDAVQSRFARNGHDKSVRGARARILVGREGQAARHARRLVDDCPSGACAAPGGHGPSCSPLARDPSTDMWQLLEALGVIQPD